MRIALLIATLGLNSFAKMEGEGGDQAPGGAPAGAPAAPPAGDELAGVRAKYTGADGNVEVDRLLGDYRNTQSEYDKLRSSRQAPEAYQFGVPEAYAETVGEIDFNSDVYKSLSEWGRQNGLGQEAMGGLMELFWQDQHNNISAMMEERSKFKNTLGNNWEETQNQLFNIVHNMTGTGLQEGATEEQQQAHQNMNGLLQELTNFPEGVALLRAIEANSRDPNVGVAGGYTPPTSAGTADDRRAAHTAWMDARKKYNGNDDHPEVKKARAEYDGYLQRQNAAGMLGKGQGM